MIHYDVEEAGTELCLWWLPFMYKTKEGKEIKLIYRFNTIPIKI